ncbi:helix-turn-helix domain-containing protein [Micromonospora sp. CPCC 205371]|nr:helix-turn-helix domain-containing protein [Micromonospora sp. CPCC 205371]
MALPNPSRPAGSFADLIREAREQKGWTLDELARRSGVSRAELVRWEAGEVAEPHPDRVRAVCRALGVDPRRAGVALRFLVAEDAPELAGVSVEEMIEMLTSRSVSDAVKRKIIERFRSLRHGWEVMRSSPQLDEEVRRQLAKLAIVAHQAPADVLAILVRAEYDRRFPGERDVSAPSAEERRERLWQVLGIPGGPVQDPEAEQRLDEALAAVEVDARRIYGEDDDGRAVA